MTFNAKAYFRKPKNLHAVEVTNENIDELAESYAGSIRRSYGPNARVTAVLCFIVGDGIDDGKLADIAVKPGDFVVFDPEREHPIKMEAEDFNKLYEEKPEQFIHEDYSK